MTKEDVAEGGARHALEAERFEFSAPVNYDSVL
jgi:hypothetical protein